MRDTSKRRVTVDLDPDEHRALKQFALDHDATISDVLRAVLDDLRRDKRLQRAIGGRLALSENELILRNALLFRVAGGPPHEAGPG